MNSAGFFMHLSICPAGSYGLSLPHSTMQQLIASYLFQNRVCPLPGFGTLSVQQSGAVPDFTNHLIAPPEPSILFSDKELNAAGLISYIAIRNKTTEPEAEQQLRNFCEGIKAAIAKTTKAALPGIGYFYIDEHDNTIFEQVRLPLVFRKPVEALRVIHPNAEHSILVGDKETTNTQMTEYYSEEEPKKNRWWVWAIVIAALSVLALISYSASSNAAFFGNAIKI